MLYLMNFERKSMEEPVSLTNPLLRLMEKTEQRDLLLKMGRLCPDFSIFDLLGNNEAAQNFFMHTNAQTIQELECCFRQNKFLSKIKVCDWPRNQRQFVFRHPINLLTEDVLN